MRLFEDPELEGKLLPLSDFKLFSDLGKSPAPEYMSDADKKSIIETADCLLEKPIPQLYASQYMRFFYDGNRSEYEESYFTRRRMLRTLSAAELIDGSGRYIKKIADLIWLICEETTWVVPAHNSTIEYTGGRIPLPEDYGDTAATIDLFSAETGADLAFTRYLLGDKLKAVSPQLFRRIGCRLERNILKPFESRYFPWSGIGPEKFTNNWNPWVISNILTAAALTVEDPERRTEIIKRALFILDNFTDIYAPDGGCDEGPSYWSVAGASYFDCIELIYDLTGGKVSFFDSPLLHGMCDYIRKAYISGDYYVNFADSPASLPTCTSSARQIARMGRRTGNTDLSEFAHYLSNKSGSEVPFKFRLYSVYRDYKNLVDACEVPYDGKIDSTVFWFESTQVAAIREKSSYDSGLFFAIKGGHNNENHNHNDIGSFVVYKDGKPFIIDIGVGTYTKDTFNENRYKIFTMQSSYHNLPDIGCIGQSAGAEYAASDVSFIGGVFSAELKSAYPEETGILSYVRTGRMDGDKVMITDDIKLSSAKPVIFNFISARKPYFCGNSVIFENGGEMTFDSGLSSSFEEISLADEKLIKAWNRTSLYRIRLASETDSLSSSIIIK